MKREVLGPMLLLASVSLELACGGAVQGAPDGSADDGGAKTDGMTSDAGWTKCKAPSGVSVCGGAEQCGADCPQCLDWTPGDTGLRACWSGPISGGNDDAEQCPDGALLARDSASSTPSADVSVMSCVNEDLGKLYALNGRPDLVRYSDRGTYSGDPIPSPPTTCPQVPGLNLCGGACGACPDPTNQICMGRSPLHPYSLCVNKFGKVNTPTSCKMGNGNVCNFLGAGLKCLTFKVDTASQSIADVNGMCVSPAICDAAVNGYPGGASCTTGSM